MSIKWINFWRWVGIITCVICALFLGLFLISKGIYDKDFKTILLGICNFTVHSFWIACLWEKRETKEEKEFRLNFEKQEKERRKHSKFEKKLQNISSPLDRELFEL